MMQISDRTSIYQKSAPSKRVIQLYFNRQKLGLLTLLLIMGYIRITGNHKRVFEIHLMSFDNFRVLGGLKGVIYCSDAGWWLQNPKILKRVTSCILCLF